MVQAYLWLFRAKRLMKRARGNQWLFTDRSSSAQPSVSAIASDWPLIKQRVGAISRSARYPVHWAFCLQKSLALREWLAKDGIITEVRYGVRKRADAFDAHAWVVYDGKIINDSVQHVSTFAPLKSLSDYGRSSQGQIQDALVTSKTVGDVEDGNLGETARTDNSI